MSPDPRRPVVAADGAVVPLVWPRPGSAWVDDAACVAHPDLGWTTDRDRLTRGDLSRMADVCATCPVRTWCAAEASTAKAGFWAGQHREPLRAAVPAVKRRARRLGAATVTDLALPLDEAGPDLADGAA